MRGALAILTLLTMGCATVQPGPLCQGGQPMMPAMDTRFIAVKLELSCAAGEGQVSTAKLTIESSQWIWTALGSMVGAGLAAAFASNEPDPLERAMAELRAGENGTGPRTILEPVRTRKVDKGTPTRLAPPLVAGEGLWSPPWIEAQGYVPGRHQ